MVKYIKHESQKSNIIENLESKQSKKWNDLYNDQIEVSNSPLLTLFELWVRRWISQDVPESPKYWAESLHS